MSKSYEMSAEIPVFEKKILLVEDEHVFANAVKKHLQRAGYHVHYVADLKTARQAYKTMPADLILLDMRLPDGSGLDFLTDIKSSDGHDISVIVMSAYAELEDAVSAMKQGAADYLKKPIDLDELLINIRKVFDKSALSQKLTYSTKRERHAAETVEFLGECRAIRAVRQQIKRISQLSQKEQLIPPTVLILGETGTGKDVAARLLHAYSARHLKPFVHVDCASLPKDLIESELFGHEKGAFTNAHVARTGLIEAAEDGVLFLDEVGELPLDLQSKLLAVLERRTLRRVGMTQERSVAAWMLAATNRDLKTLVENGTFRSDLYYRLNVMSLRMPSLRHRENDIMLLAHHFAQQTARRYGVDIDGFSPQAKEAMMNYDWPGNIRELKYFIERAVLLSNGKKVEVDIPELENKRTVMQQQGDEMTLGETELKLIQQALDRTNRNVSKAARELGITRMTLRYRIKKYNL